MVPFTRQEVPPALKSHMDAQFSFLADLSRKMFDGLQRIGQLNIQVAQTVMEEALNQTHQMLESSTLTDYIGIAASQVQPAAEKMRAYQHHLDTISAGVQAELSKTAEQHVPETARTAAAAAEEVARIAAEETDRVTQRQREAFEKLAKPINDGSDRQGQRNGGMQAAQQPSAQARQPAGKSA